MSIVLDTTVLIDVLRGRPGALDRLGALRRSRNVPYTTAVNVEEIHRGLRQSEADVAAKLFGGVRVAQIGRIEGARAGGWRREYAASGITLAQADCLIAATAVSLRVPLATGNPKHFPMSELEVQHWPAGE